MARTTDDAVEVAGFAGKIVVRTIFPGVGALVGGEVRSRDLREPHRAKSGADARNAGNQSLLSHVDFHPLRSKTRTCPCAACDRGTFDTLSGNVAVVRTVSQGKPEDGECEVTRTGSANPVPDERLRS